VACAIFEVEPIDALHTLVGVEGSVAGCAGLGGIRCGGAGRAGAGDSVAHFDKVEPGQALRAEGVLGALGALEGVALDADAVGEEVARSALDTLAGRFEGVARETRLVGHIAGCAEGMCVNNGGEVKARGARLAGCAVSARAAGRVALLALNV